MTSSGIEVSSELKDDFNKMKLGKLETPLCLMVMQLSDDKKSVIKKPDLCRESCSHKDLLDFHTDDAMKKDCCYSIFDYNNKLLLIKWTPDTAPASKKMVYASTFQALKTAFSGIKYIEASDLDDLSESELKKGK